MSQNVCPKCGAAYKRGPDEAHPYVDYACGSWKLDDPDAHVVESEECLTRQLTARDAEVERLRTALRFYANPHNYEESLCIIGDVDDVGEGLVRPAIDDSIADVARKALEATDG